MQPLPCPWRLESTPPLPSHHAGQSILGRSNNLDGHAALPGLAAVELDPAVDSTRLDADHVLPPIGRPEVAHALALLAPGVPDHAVLHAVPRDAVDGLATLADRQRRHVVRVDAVELAGEGDGRLGCWAGGRGVVADLVSEGGRLEAGDGDFGNVLSVVSIVSVDRNERQAG